MKRGGFANPAKALKVFSRANQRVCLCAWQMQGGTAEYLFNGNGSIAC